MAAAEEEGEAVAVEVVEAEEVGVGEGGQAVGVGGEGMPPGGGVGAPEIHLPLPAKLTSQCPAEPTPPSNKSSRVFLGRFVL